MDCTYTDFTQLYMTPFSLTSLFAVRQKWQNGVLFRRDSPRKSTGLIYLHRCNGRYTAADGTAFDAQPGSVVCLRAAATACITTIVPRSRTTPFWWNLICTTLASC